MPKISVIIPTYNMAHYLPYSIESVFSQTFKDLETIVVDDGSTDNTKEVIVPYLERIMFLEGSNAGPSKARNRAIRKSSGEYVAFLDADDIWYPDKLERQLAVFSINQDFNLVHSDALITFKENSKEDQLWFSGHKRLKLGWVFSDLLNENFIILSSAIVKRDCLNRIGLFDEDLKCWEGYDLWLRIAYENQIGFVNKPLFLRQIHESNLFYSSTLNRITDLIAVMEKWDDKDSQLSEVDKKIINQQLRELYLQLGKYYLADENSAEARQTFKKAFVRRPSLISCLYLALTTLPSFAVSFIRNTRQLQYRCLRKSRQYILRILNDLRQFL